MIAFVRRRPVERCVVERGQVIEAERNQSSVRRHDVNAAATHAFHVKTQGVLKGHGGNREPFIRAGTGDEAGKGVVQWSLAFVGRAPVRRGKRAGDARTFRVIRQGRSSGKG